MLHLHSGILFFAAGNCLNFMSFAYAAQVLFFVLKTSKETLIYHVGCNMIWETHEWLCKHVKNKGLIELDLYPVLLAIQ